MHKKNLFFYVASLLFTQLAYTQSIDSTQLETSWKVDEAGYNTTPYYQADRFEKSIVYLSAGEAVALVQFPKGGSGVLKVFADGTTGWEYRIEGKMIGLGKFGAGIIAFYEPKKSEGQIHAVMLDATSGKQLLDRTVYQGQQELLEDIVVQNRPSGVFNDLMIRTTSAKIAPSLFFRGDYRDKSGSSTGCKALFFSPELEVEKTVVMKVAENFRLLGALAGDQGSIFVCNKVDDQLVVEEYSETAPVPRKLHVPFETRTGSMFTAVINLDAANGKNVLAAVSYLSTDKDDVFQVFQFNFAASKASGSTAQICDKSYAKGVETVEVKGASRAKLPGSIHLLVPQKILRAGDKLVVLRDARSVTPSFNDKPGLSKAVFVNGPSIVTFLDSKLNIQKEFALLKNQESFLDIARSMGAMVQNGKVYVVSSALTGLATYSNLYYVIDAGSMSVEKAEMLQNLPGGGAVPAESDATFWFGDHYLLNRVRPKSKLFSSALRVSTALDLQPL